MQSCTDLRFIVVDWNAHSIGLFVNSTDLETEKQSIIGNHDDAIKSISICSNDRVISGGWDKKLKIWDIRTKNMVEQLEQSGKVYSMDCIDNTVVVALEGRIIQIYDLRNMKLPQQRRDSSLKHMLRTVGCMKNGKGHATGSVEGRIAVDYFDNAVAVQSKKFSFKCHRLKVLTLIGQ